MKKTFLFYTLITLLISTNALSQDRLTALRARETMTIDGNGDELAWERASWYFIDQTWLGTTPSAEDFSGRYKLTYDSGYLYILAEITDDVLKDTHSNWNDNYWNDDCLEIFLDENRSKGDHQGNYNAWAMHISLTGDVVDEGSISGQSWGPNLYNDAIKTARKKNGNVYTWECRIKVYGDDYVYNGNNTAKVLTNGKVMGFSVAYCDNDGGNERQNFMGSGVVPGADKNVGYKTADYFQELTLEDYLSYMPETYMESRSGKLTYGWYLPANYDPSIKYPVVTYLHGWSWTKTDFLNWYSTEVQGKNPCIVFTPKTPTTWDGWSGWNDTDLSEPMTVAMKVLDSLSNVYSVDKNRLYVHGISMGGEGVFDLLDKLQNKFAAAISICGGGQSWWADNVAQTPLWMFHGSADQINTPDMTERVYYKMVSDGAKKMRYTNYPGYGHDIWDKAQSEPSFYDWMFTFTKGDATCPSPNKTITLSGGPVSNSIELNWNDIRNANEKANKIWYYNVYNSYGVLSTVEYDQKKYSFTPPNSSDGFAVEAVNYCFEKSARSNTILYPPTPLPKSNRPADLLFYTKDKKLNIEVVDETNNCNTSIKIFALDGKQLMSKEYTNTYIIEIDISLFNESAIIVIVKNNNIVTRKTIFNN